MRDVHISVQPVRIFFVVVCLFFFFWSASCWFMDIFWASYAVLVL